MLFRLPVLREKKQSFVLDFWVFDASASSFSFVVNFLGGSDVLLFLTQINFKSWKGKRYVFGDEF